jgi:hypothetical protein
MYKEVVLRPFLVFVQGSIDDQLEVRGRGGGGMSVRHGRESQQFVREDDGGFVGVGQSGTARWALHCLVGLRQYSQDHVKLARVRA